MWLVQGRPSEPLHATWGEDAIWYQGTAYEGTASESAASYWQTKDTFAMWHGASPPMMQLDARKEWRLRNDVLHGDDTRCDAESVSWS